ncbi:MAG TPA: patatin-like phospholipase family protein [Gemmataceae bacterium]
MVVGRGKWQSRLFATCLLALIAQSFGCHFGAHHRPIPFTPPHAIALAPADDPCSPSGCAPRTTLTHPGETGPYDDSICESCPMRQPRNVVAFSGGGAYGAYSAGFLAGWTQAGTRPEFDVVTGISTGSLIAPFAFLGPDYDVRLGQLYTRSQAQDIFRVRTWIMIPFKDSIAMSLPLRNLIESQITPDLMEKIAAEHRKGRRLYVGTTNLDTRRLVVWDMGAIACRPCPDSCHLFRDILLASCSVPGMLPPVKFELDVDGRRVTELHGDGGITAQIFVPSHVFAMAGAAMTSRDAEKSRQPIETGNLYAVVAGKLYPDATPVRARVLPVLGASTTAMMYAYCRADLSNMYGMARAAGLRYHLAALDANFQTLETSVDFDQGEMQKLFDEGICQGSVGPSWMSGPPTLSPGDGDFIRNGIHLRTVPEMERK